MQLNVPFDLVGHAALSLAPMFAPHIGGETLELSLAAVNAIDASGVALLVRLGSHLASCGGRLSLTDVREPLMQELRRIGLAGLLTTKPAVAVRATSLSFGYARP